MVELVLKRADADDLDELIALENAVKRSLPYDDMLVVDDKAFYKRLLDSGGRILIARGGDMAVGAGIISFPQEHDPDDLCGELNLSPAQAARVVRIESVYILEAYRGQRLAERLLKELLRYAQMLGKDLSLSTIWPGNAANLSAVFRQGRTLRKLVRKYGGLPRFIIMGAPTPPPVCGDTVWVRSMDLDGHAKQFADGKIGITMRKDEGSAFHSLAFDIGYRRLDTSLSS